MNKLNKDRIRTYARDTVIEELSFVGRTLVVPSNAPIGSCPTCHGAPVYIIPNTDEDNAGGVYVSCLIKLSPSEVATLGVDLSKPLEKPTPKVRKPRKPKIRAVKGGGKALMHRLAQQKAQMAAELERLKKEAEG